MRQYAIGTLALSTATQAGLASTLSGLSAFGLGLDWIAEHPARLLATTVDDVSAAAAEFFAPGRLHARSSSATRRRSPTRSPTAGAASNGT